MEVIIDDLLLNLEDIDNDTLDKIEKVLESCNEAQNTGEQIVSDSIYDHLVGVLSTHRPDSEVLREIWEEDGDITDYTSILLKNPMCSIRTVKSWEDDVLKDFIENYPEDSGCFLSYKINGHGVRVVYDDGVIVSATSRARASAGRDITRQMVEVLGSYNGVLAGNGLVEIRGEICIPLDRLSKAREFNPEIKSAFTAVSSLVKPSASAEECKLLDFIAYSYLTEDGYPCRSKQEEYELLQDCGFQVPLYTYCEGYPESVEEVQSLLSTFEDDVEDYNYFTDGVVFEVDDREAFNNIGGTGKWNIGNVALKVGFWKQDLYTGVVQDIIWTRGKNKLSPVAVVAGEDGIGVLTAQGNRVRNVPIYEPKNILVLDAYPGEVISFRYGGEAGVVPCRIDGTLLTEEAVDNLLGS